MKHIAVIGSGIAGLTSAYLLSKKHQVSVFEKNDYIGGHTATIDVNHKGEQLAIDTGFIVFNNKTYPLFLQLLDEIGVGKQETEMSFSVHNLQTGFEYNGHNLNTLFAQRRNIVRPRFWHLISEILRFNRHCKDLHTNGLKDDGQTLGEFLVEHSYSRFFCEHYILPMGAAIWSSSVEEMEAFELKFFIRFFHNHGLLNIADRPQWYVIPGGSKQYIAPLINSFAENITLNADIQSVTRQENSVTLHFGNGDELEFDEVVFACHSDQALALLGDASAEEKQVLGDIPYQANSVVLHTDTKLLPKRKKAWASWNYQLTSNRSRPASVTYNMNILQGLQAKNTYCVTLNQEEDIKPEKIIQKFEYHHPVFNLTSMAAQQNRSLICGQRNTHFVGAYWYNGFHEDGVRSANDVAERFDCQLQSSEHLSKLYG
ncbi:NAD(P)/FAD-dependent oxidoreductase [Thalassotalea euphylliae]|uniref:FAD-dependent oxidoreductase n=1 Tax=Thalassotalea euphylliae TaxID=1655234 RepID=A0A3E0UF93_9GAMM|nr:FAD-dependent oxidoreductase [Thalassotalea euphylliae]REL35559.1 FAD-dependent oxidoreductase [Thalassotalea euphylliae]